MPELDITCAGVGRLGGGTAEGKGAGGGDVGRGVARGGGTCVGSAGALPDRSVPGRTPGGGPAGIGRSVPLLLTPVPAKNKT